MAKPQVGFRIDEETVQAGGALHTSVKTLSDGSTNLYHVSVWGPANPKSRLLLDGQPNPYFKA